MYDLSSFDRPHAGDYLLAGPLLAFQLEYGKWES